MKIQISPKRIVPDALTIWHEHGPEVDIVMDPKNLTFAEGSIEAIFSFHVLDHLFPNEVHIALSNWKKCLLPTKGVLFVIVDDFEYVARALVGGDINIDMYNSQFTHPTQFTKDNLSQALADVGFPESQIRLWYVDVPNLFKKADYELVLSTENI